MCAASAVVDVLEDDRGGARGTVRARSAPAGTDHHGRQRCARVDAHGLSPADGGQHACTSVGSTPVGTAPALTGSHSCVAFPAFLLLISRATVCGLRWVACDECTGKGRIAPDHPVGTGEGSCLCPSPGRPGGPPDVCCPARAVRLPRAPALAGTRPGGPGPAHGDGRWPGAADRRPDGAGVGEHPVARHLRGAARRPLRGSGTRTGTVGAALDRRRAAHRLLPGRRDRTQTRTRDRPAAHPGHRGPARGRRGVRHGGARRDLPGHDRGRRRPGRRLGGADGDRHRFRTRGPRRAQHPHADRAAGLPAHPGGRRRPRRDPGHRGVLHRPPEPGSPRRGRRRAGRLLPAATVQGARMVVVRALGGGHLDADVQRRGARHRGRGGDRADPSLRPRPGCGRGRLTRGARRAPAASGVGRCRRSALRAVRRRG
ncbi:hypothetical protein RKD26_003142 [Streptomyces calvus]